MFVNVRTRDGGPDAPQVYNHSGQTMAKCKKNASRFGLGKGKHKRTRKDTRGVRKTARTTYTYTCSQKTTGIKLTIAKIPARKSISSKTLGQAYQLYKSGDTGHNRKRRVSQVFDCVHNVTNGYRIINLASLEKHVSEISLHTAVCDNARALAATGISPIQLDAEVATYGLASVLSAKCKGCNKDFLFETSKKLEDADLKTKHFDINVRAVWGCLATGNGNAHLNEFLACLDSPGLGQKTYQNIEHDINEWWRSILQKDLENTINEEKRIAIQKGSFHQGIPAVTVICDGGWSKRTHKHSYNALGGVAIIIGAATQKLLHIGVRNKHCTLCSRAETLGCTPRPHECFRNWQESSQAMEADIIVEGFLKANDYGVRYMHMVGDGDSSVFAHIREKVPVWGAFVTKLECANHICKCLRSSLEKLVVDKPMYKGRGKLTKNVRIRLVTAVRCAIRMRSMVSDHVKASQLLEHDIRNSVDHVYGNHTRCSKDFCKAKQTENTGILLEPDNDPVDGDVMSEQASFWTEGASLAEQEQSRENSGLTSTDLSQCAKMRQDIALLLDRVAAKSSRLIGNYTTNLAESWMHIRSKFDGGKVVNHCNRGSWHTRCYAGGLRLNLGTQWSPMAWEQSTGTYPGQHFSRLYERREQHLRTCNKSKAKPQSNIRRWKRKRAVAKVNSTKKAKKEYGPDALDVTPDMSPDDLTKCKEAFIDQHINISAKKIQDIEITTRGQSTSDVWKEERKKRLTSSYFGQIVKRNPKIKVKPLVNQILYNTFKGNSATDIGITKEEATRLEYIQINGKRNNTVQVASSGLVIHPSKKFLAASPDGFVTDDTGRKLGMIEIKNVLYNKPLSLTTAAKITNVKNFCLHLVNGELCLKRNHNYYYQCQGLLNITDTPWLDFVVRTENPYEIHIERITKDVTFWSSVMLPKLEAFFELVLLPELAASRFGKVPGIREPGVWYHLHQPPRTTKKSVGKRIPLPLTAGRSSPHVDSPGPSHSNTTTGDVEEGDSSRISQSRKRKTKFGGRRISHQWIIDEEQGTVQWYNGTVVGVLEGKDGCDNAVYEVIYDDEEEPFVVDHLLEDYAASQVKFIDI